MKRMRTISDAVEMERAMGCESFGEQLPEKVLPVMLVVVF